MADDFQKHRDPAVEKARNTGRQRKIVTNSSDKASRKNAPRIKAMANRNVRRSDKQTLRIEADEFEDSADQINIAHRHKPRHWGSDNAAERREMQAEKQATYREVGGRNEVQRRQMEAFRKKVDNKAMLQHIDETIARLKKK
ncbi:hypothetical protein OS189_02820 [Sulfitobacter sp. F26169L]|uniref:hypothetical protein n=1 Tax=Sulfitobacter sp. F26169L TaxID=2996015 RepID=UPI002260BB0E|nr:hypothetical protein [Sulfitobacter sp. F26169L]MCX7565275.1 hypothetical protein [Sulfitobacter sp. F26169L]